MLHAAQNTHLVLFMHLDQFSEDYIFTVVVENECECEDEGSVEEKICPNTKYTTYRTYRLIQNSKCQEEHQNRVLEIRRDLQ